MDMKPDYDIIKAVKQRRSVRTYLSRPLELETLEKIKDYIRNLGNPFGAEVRVGLVQRTPDSKAEKIGTYGTVKGASTFLGLSAVPGPKALVAAGYAFEDLILYCTSLGLGTVWLAATFTRDRFRTALGIPEGYLFPAISPVGYAADKRLVERVMRAAVGSDRRKPWKELFFDGDFGRPLSEDAAGRCATALEMLRLAPSSTNSQPWRVVRRGGTFHFFVVSKSADADIKQVDMGIGLFHFTKTLEAEGMSGTYSDACPADLVLPKYHRYVLSYTVEAE